MGNKFTIITPSFNQGRFLERTIQSVLSQNFPDLEYLVFDGGSTDSSVDVLRKYQDKLSWVSERDKGQADAVNKGLAAAKGNIIGWLNSDDIYYPGAFQAVDAFFTAHPEIDIVYGNANHIDVDDKIIEAYPTEEWDLERLKETCFICQPAVFFRRSIVDKFGALEQDLRYCMDYEFWVRLALNNVAFGHINMVLAGSRLYPETKTLGSRVKVHAEINTMLKRHFGETPAKWLFNYGHVVAENKGLQNKSRFLFVLVMGCVSIYAALKWNKKLNIQMLKIIKRDLASAIRFLTYKK